MANVGKKVMEGLKNNQRLFFWGQVNREKGSVTNETKN